MAIKSSNVVARVEPDIKTKAEAIMASLGVPASVVINALYHQVIYTKSIPFSISIPANIPALENMSEEEFDLTMESSFEQAKNGEGESAKEVLDSIRSRIR